MMQKESERVIVVGAGPVGLCLSLALAQAGVEVCTIEALGENNFLEQVPRAGTNHPATLELYERIGLYAKLEPRGIIAPLVHYWDRREHRLIAEFDHAHLKDDTRFPYVLQCERIKIVEEALKLAKAHPNIELRLASTFTGFAQDSDGVTARITNASGDSESVRGVYLVSAEGARSIVRKELDIDFEGFTYPDRTLNVEVAFDFRKYGYTERNYISDRGDGHEQRRSRRVQSGGQAHQDFAPGSRRRGARPLRAPAPPRRANTHAGADHPQQAPAGGKGFCGAPAQPRGAAPDRGRSQTGARFSAAHLADREPARSRADCVSKAFGTGGATASPPPLATELGFYPSSATYW